VNAVTASKTLNNALGQTWSRCNKGLDCFGTVKYVDKLLGCPKTGCIALPEYPASPNKFKSGNKVLQMNNIIGIIVNE
jgi:hypothetical protein